MRFIIFLSIFFASFINVYAQRINTKSVQKRSFVIPTEDIINLNKAPNDAETTNKALGIPLTFSLPNGESIRYNFLKNDVMSFEMKTKYPEIATYTGYSETFKSHIVSLTLHNNKIHAFILGANENTVMIDQVVENEYESTYGERTETFECTTDHDKFRPFMPSGARTSTNGSTLKNYDFGVVITDEYEAANGGGAAAIAVAVATINDITTIYKRDLAVTFTATIRPETSAFNVNPSLAGASYAGTCVTAYFTQNEYDIGHVFHNLGSGFGGSGVAQLNAVCSNSGGSSLFKGRGWSAGGSNVGYGFMSIVAHEMAHMFSATHSFNGQANFCGQGLSAANSFEPGSGTTLMAYPGICTSDNITDQGGNAILSTSPYFHVRSLEQMVSFITGTSGNSCASGTATNNTPPVAIANPCNATSITIPANTPFELTGSHTDGNGDAVTYNWEQYDPGPPHGAPNVACGGTSGPIFRSYSPTTLPTRYFPSLNYILNNNNVPPFNTIGECLPTANRTLNFRLTVRDNNVNGGGIDVSAIQLSVSNTTGPLAVTTPNTNVTWTAGNTHTVTWSGFNTTSICSTVNIKLSIDGGQTFPYSLATNTANDGTQSVTFPSNLPPSSTCRVKVESSCFTCVKFFDISNVNFNLSSSCLIVGSNICPANPVTLPVGDSQLNLGLTNSFGNEIISKTLTASGSAVNISFNSNPPAGPGTCSSGFNGFAQSSVRFKISTPGLYTFTSSNLTIFSIYSGTYNVSTPCTNYLGSTAYDADGEPGGSINLGNSMTLNLTNTCGDYSGVLFRPSGSSSTLTITGPNGAVVYENNVPTGSGYAYTYAAVNASNNTITAVNNASNFTSLGAGTYCVYGVRYISTLIPTSWIGQTFTQLFSSGNCMLESYNCKPVTVTGACTPLVTSSANSGPGTLRDIAGCAAEGASITLSSGINPLLTSALVIDKNLTIDGNVNGLNQPITEITLNFSGSYGIKVNPSKTVTFKDLKVNMTSTASPVVLNEGNLTLNNAEIKGNVDPVINNTTGSTINVSNTVTIKK